MNRLQTIVLIALLGWTLPVWTQVSGEDATLDYLLDMLDEDYAKLAEVEITLDKAFDVFDGLVHKQRVSVASGVTQSKARAPSVTSVITAQDIEASGARTLHEALAAVPGLHTGVLQAGLRYEPIYILRGIASNLNPEVLVMVNGVPINTLNMGYRAAWGDMPLHAVARIEIIRGPGSAVHGADAFSGTIHIITKKSDDINGMETGVRAGRFDTRDIWLLHGGQWGGFDVAGGIQYQTTAGHRETVNADAQTGFDTVFGTQASLAPGPVNTQRRGVDLHLDVSRGAWRARSLYQKRNNIGSGTGLGAALDPEGRWRGERLIGDLSWRDPLLIKYWDIGAQLSYFRHRWQPETHQRIYPRGAFGGAYPDGFIGNPGTSETQTRLDLFGLYAPTPAHLIRIGGGYFHGDLYEVRESKNFGIHPVSGELMPPGSPVVDVADTAVVWLPEKDRQAWYLSLQDTWRFAADWELTAGIRYDEYADFGATVNPRAALVWEAATTLTAKLMYGRAFRAPTFVEQFSQNNPLNQGNPDLQAEIIHTWELAFDYRPLPHLHLALNLFSYRNRDKILWVPDPNPDPALGAPPALARNAGKQNGHGLEFESRWKLNARSSLLLNYAYAKATDKTLDVDVPKVPRHMAYIRMDRLLRPNWYLDVQANWIGERLRENGDPRTPLAGYTTVDLTLRYKNIHQDKWNFATGIRNLCDEAAFEPGEGPNSDGMLTLPGDLPLAGRSWWGEIRYRFD